MSSGESINDRRDCGTRCVALIKLRVMVRILMCLVSVDLLFNAYPIVFANDMNVQVHSNQQKDVEQDKKIDNIHDDVQQMIKEVSTLTGMLKVIHGLDGNN